MQKPEFLIYGRKPVMEALRHEPKLIRRVYVRDSIKASGLEEIRELARKNSIGVQVIDEKEFKSMLADDVNHQGVAAARAPFEYANFEEWLHEIDVAKNPLILILDHLQDVTNLGAIVRTATAAGLSGIIVAELNQAPVTTAVYKTSAGTLGRIPIIQVGNLNQTIDRLKDKGFWIAGLTQDGTTYWHHKFEEPTALIVGSEGEGIRLKTLERCDFKLSIPMEHKVESLNAAASAGLVAYEWKRQMGK